MRWTLLGALFAALLPSVPAAQQSDPCSSTNDVSTAFTCLYSIFPRGSGDGTIGAALARSMAASGDTGGISSEGPLILVNGYGVFVYDGAGEDAGTLLDHVLTRSDPDTGFVEMTALSHVGPAVAYLAALAEAGADSYPDLRDALLARVRAARSALAADPDWQDDLDVPAWAPHSGDINAMLDYGLWMAGDYLVRVRDGSVAFTQDSVGRDFYGGGLDAYAVPFDNVMIATFMLVDLNSVAAVRAMIERLPADVDLANARVLVHMAIGTNFGAGLTLASNQLAHAVQVLSDDAIGPANILIAPYANAPCQPAAASECPLETFTAEALDPEVYDFYSTSTWFGTYDRTLVAEAAFTGIDPIPEPAAPGIPGDYAITAAEDIDGFMQRLRNSLVRETELLSNAVGFWMPDELRAKGWDASAVEIPGLTTGFPEGTDGYPTDLPPIPD
ncbi:DUF5624 domain-containing protein [Roseivivax marinus]|uniref:DUF5624 domain-containing protein n=1 Tax=Roseivivax marinus TaxID=1379903 RepID=UPI00273D86B8|nr:DUF5624 domain-containing protein [Roseivivax marinus]